jgi:hypothetical protein
MIHLSYKGIEVKPDMYCLEYTNEDGIDVFEPEFGLYAYQRLLIKAFDLQVDGYIVYCITRTRQKIKNGLPIKRGRKREKDRTDAIGKGFRSQIPEPPSRLIPIQ